jgi:SAM-dependent methyltransferase
MNFEDHFSELAGIYSKYRPGYPPELYKFLADSCGENKLAWDCGTGNGQAALELVKYFRSVYATDASKEQIKNAAEHPSITYKIEPAEKVSLKDSTADLVTVAVAVHWFDFDKFFAEAKRILKSDGIIAVWTYHLPRIASNIDAAVKKYYSEVLRDFWPERFHYVHTGYSDLPFPFDEIEVPEFTMRTEWNLDQLSGFLSSWSAVNKYRQVKGIHPMNEICEELKNAWGDEREKKILQWPLNVRAGRNIDL